MPPRPWAGGYFREFLLGGALEATCVSLQGKPVEALWFPFATLRFLRDIPKLGGCSLRTYVAEAWWIAVKRILVLGATGMLGQEVCRELTASDYPLRGLSSADCDLYHEFPHKELHSANLIVNCAAFTAVDRAETEGGEVEAQLLNSRLPTLLADWSTRMSVPVIHISTDYVFWGDADTPYLESDESTPLNAYGRSKVIGEEQVLMTAFRPLVFRTSWLFGPGGNCFPKKMIRRRSQHEPTKVVADQFGSPTSAIALAKQIVQAIQLDIEPGLYHAGGPEGMSWHEFAVRIWREYEAFYGLPFMDIEAITTDQYPTPAPRPKYTVLDSSKLVRAGVSPMPPLAESIREFVLRVAPELPPDKEIQ